MPFAFIKGMGGASRGGSASNVHVGVDVGQRRVKVVELVRSGRGVTLRHVVDEPVAPGVFDDGQLVNPAAGASQVGQLLRESRIRVRDVALAVPVAEGLRRIPDYPPAMREETLKSVRSLIAGEIGEQNPLALAVDFHELAVSPDGRRDLLVAVGKRDVVRAFQRIVSDAGVRPSLVSVPAVALANAFNVCRPDRVQGGGLVVLVHGGHAGVLFVVLQGGVPVVTHSTRAGIDSVVKTVLGTQTGANPRYVEESLFNTGASPVNPAVMQEWIGRLAQEIRRTVAGAGGDAAHGVGEVWLSGGMVRVAGLQQQLAAQLGAPVEVFDPLVALHADGAVRDSVCGPALAVAVGLALESASLASQERSLVHVNLWQPEPRRGGVAGLPSPVAIQGALRDPAIVGALAIAGVALLGGFALERALEAKTRKVVEQTQEADATIAQLGSATQHAEQLKKQQAALQAQLAAIRKLAPDRFAFVRLVDRAAGVIPPEVWVEAVVLDNVDLGSGAVDFRIRGFAPSADFVSAYERRLLASGVVGSAEITGTTTLQVAGNPVLRFEITGRAGTSATPYPGYAGNGSVVRPAMEKRP